MTFKEFKDIPQGFSVRLDTAKERHYFEQYTYHDPNYDTDIVKHLKEKLPHNDSVWGVIYTGIPNSGSISAIVFIDALTESLFNELKNEIISYIRQYEVKVITSKF